MFKRVVRASLRRTKNWFLDEGPRRKQSDFSKDTILYPWFNAMHSELLAQPGGAQRPQYAWGVLQGASLAKHLQIPQISVVEFGVAGGNGLVALDRIAVACEAISGVKIHVYGFDAGVGLPKPLDYRDSPNLFSENDFPMDVPKLRRRLLRANLILGLLQETVPAFIASQLPPVAFISFDVDLYRSTVQAFKLLEAPYSMLLPRIHCYFDDILGFTHGDFTGERLAISEFNQTHQMRKISPLYGLKYYVNPESADQRWVECIWMAHFFDHELYQRKDGLIRTSRMDLKESIS